MSNMSRVKEELEALCDNHWRLSEQPTTERFRGITKCVAGVDWSGGGTSGVSRTVLWIWGFRAADQKLVCMLYKVFPGKNPVHIIDEIAQLCNAYRVEVVIGDAGEGFTANNLLRTKLGHHRVIQLQYGSQKEALKWNDLDRYMADRTCLIDNFFMYLKNQSVQFAALEEMLQAIEDMLNVFEEVTKSGKKIAEIIWFF